MSGLCAAQSVLLSGTFNYEDWKVSAARLISLQEVPKVALVAANPDQSSTPNKAPPGPILNQGTAARLAVAVQIPGLVPSF